MPESTPIPWSPNPFASHNTNQAIPAIEIPCGYTKYETHTLQAYLDFIFGLWNSVIINE